MALRTRNRRAGWSILAVMAATPGGIRVSLSIGSAPVRQFELTSPALCGSGRAADLRITDPGVAPLQLRLARDGDAIVAIAVASGVEVDGAALSVDEPTVVTGRALRLGPARLVVAPWDSAPTLDPARTESLARELMRDLLGHDHTVPPPELVIETGPAAGQRLALPAVGARVVIGRGETSWVVLDPDLSRSHAVVEHRADGVWLHDLDSKNGTRVNGVVAPSEPPGLVLADGAVIALGQTTIRFRDPAAGALGGATAMLVADTLTRRGLPVPPPELPPRWPIVVAAVVAIAAFAVVIAMLAAG